MNDKFEKALSIAKLENRPRCPDFAQMVKDSTTDESLFEQIVECFSKSLTAFANYYCRDDSLGKDAFQDAMLTTMTHLDSYRGDSPIEPWLKRIVTSACSRLKRGLKNDPSINISLTGKEASLAAADSSPGQELQMEIAEGLYQLNREIEALDEPNRTLLLEHDIMEIPLTDLAKRHSMTLDAVKSRLKRARSEVKNRILGQPAGLKG